MKIDTVIFDIGGVLVGLGRIHFFEQFGYSHEMCQRLLDSTLRNPNWKELDIGLLSDEEVIDRFVQDTPELEQEIRACMKNIHGVVYRLETSIPWIKEIKESGRRVLYLSNYSMKVARDNEDAMDFLPYMDGGLLSCDYNVIKPDPAFYQILIDKYDLDPSKCVFLDDLEDNLAAARKFIQACDCEGARSTVPGAIFAGQRTNAGTRIPPSYTSRLNPSNGPAEANVRGSAPYSSAGPLSEVNMIIVSRSIPSRTRWRMMSPIA